MKEKIYCHICNSQTNYTNWSLFIRQHINGKHKEILTKKEYCEKFNIVENKDNFITCLICGNKEFDNDGNFARYHLRKIHNIGMKEYYDMFFKKEGEGICPICGKQTSFECSTKGYKKYCSYRCAANSPEKKEQTIQTNLKKYGVKSTVELDWIKELLYKANENREDAIKKMKETNLEKYGVENVFQLEEIKEKSKKTKLEKYGDENYRNDEQIKKTCKERYGWEYLFKDENYRRNSEDNLLIKYGVKNVFEIPEIQEKVRKTNLEKYGVENVFDSKEMQERIKKTNLLKYGFENPFQSPEIIDKIRKTNENNGRWVPLDKLTEKDVYYRDVWMETRKHISVLFENWNGLDYYTKEELISNKDFKTNNPSKHVSSNNMQPNIDHKISINFGFNNDIDPKIIGSINNLCICSKKINLFKGIMCEEEFLQKLNNKENN